MSHHPDYDSQFAPFRAQLQRTNQHAELSARNQASVNGSGVMITLIESTVAETAHARVLARVMEENNAAWSSVDAARSPPLKLEARKPTKIGPARPATQSIEDLAKHFEPRGK